MDEKSNTVDTEASLQQIRREMYVRGQRITGGQGYQGQKESDSLEFHRSLGEINTTWAVGDSLTLASSRPLIGCFVTIVKKVLHRVLRFYMDVLVRFTEQQRAFNMSTAKAISMLAARLDVLDTMIQGHEARFRTSRISAGGKPEPIEGSAKPGYHPPNNGHGIDDMAFQLRFRGTRVAVRDKLRGYIEYFRNADRVLDIGCGRGEFLELLKESGVDGFGIDTNPEMVEYCRSLSLKVEQVDAIGYLQSITDGSLDGIFTSQVIEHLQPGYLAGMLDLCLKKLKKGGVLVVETVNPTSLTALTNGFYLDLSHTKPIHPETLAFVLGEAGFVDIDFRFSAPVPPESALRKIESPQTAEAERHVYNVLNDNFEKLNRLLYGFQDYAAIATKVK